MGSAHPYVNLAGGAIDDDPRVSEARTFRGPEHTIVSEFLVSAASVEKAEEVGHEVFRAALLKAGAPAVDSDWWIGVGAKSVAELEREWGRDVTLVLNRGQVNLAGEARLALMRRLKRTHETLLLVEFEGVDRPVFLVGGAGKAVVSILDEWTLDRGASEVMPAALADLRDLLRDDMVHFFG